MAIDNSSNEKQGIGEPMPGQLIEIPYAYVSEYLRAIAVSLLAPLTLELTSCCLEMMTHLKPGERSEMIF